MRLVLIGLVFAAVVIAVILLFRPRPKVVIGTQMAQADARERLHRQRFAHLPSPLPRETYDSERGEMTLIDPQVSELDRKLRSICSRYAESSPDERSNFRNGATIDDFYTLLNFARRASVFALRERDEGWIQAALTAVATIDAARVDERDLPLALSLVHHAAERLELRRLELFDAAAALAEPQTSEMIRWFVRQSAAFTNIESSWGYQEIESAAGIGFVQRESATYQPTRDLLGIALAICEAIARDRYEGDVTLATELPAVWFPKPVREQAEGILARSVAVALVSGTLHRSAHERAAVQPLRIFIVETGSEQDAANLQRLATSSPADDPATITVQEGELFVLAVGRSFEVGVASYETRESIRRFEGPIRAALEKAGS